ncbi:hypothetical protein C5S29_16175 [ANME-1 cluster archaeon GoMg3.2]|nr:hypothetical protein [ANME-1 cluster archaeon GoMg3.2]
MKKIAIAIVVVIVVLLMQVTVYASGPVTSDVAASPNPTYGAPYVTLTADLTIDSNAILTAASSETKAGETADVAKAKVANTSNLNFTGIIIEDVDLPSQNLVSPNASFNVTVHTRYNFSRETEVVIFLYDWDAWDQNDDYIDFRAGNISGAGTKSFVFDGVAITKPKVVNLTAVAGYMNESGKLDHSNSSDCYYYFTVIALNFTIDTLKFPSTVKSNEIFNVTIGTSYNVAPVTNITLAIYDWAAEKYTARSWDVLSGSNTQTFSIPLTASASADMNLTLVPYFTYEFEDEKIQGLIGHRNFTVNVIDYWIAKAEYFIGSLGEDGTGIPMSASDGAFDSSVERVIASVPIEDLTTGSHTLYVHGMDSQGNWGSKATSVILDVTCPIAISDMDYPAEAMLYNPFPVTVNTNYYFGSQTKARISIYNHDTGQLLASSDEKALSGSGSELFRLDPLAKSLGVLNLITKAEYYLDKAQKWVSRDSSNFSIIVTCPIKITNLEYPETVNLDRSSFFTVKGDLNYSVRVRTTAMVRLYDQDREKEIGNTPERELAGTGSMPFRLDPFVRSAGTMNLSARVYYLDKKEQNWICCDSSDFSISVDQP